jgi:hypothetical protein
MWQSPQIQVRLLRFARNDMGIPELTLITHEREC